MRVLHEIGVAVGELGHDLRRAQRRTQELVQPVLALAQLLERDNVGLLERQQRKLLRGLQKLLAHAAIVLEQRGVLENDLLPREPFECGRLLEEKAARAPRLRRLQHLLAALRGEPVERQHQLSQRVHERQADEQKAQQNELEERARVVHENLDPVILGRIMAPPSPGRRPVELPAARDVHRWPPPIFAFACPHDHRHVRRRVRRAPLALIAAVARNGVIGAANALPWRLPDDLKHFRALTTGHAVIMGRKTWESLPRPLPGRQNIVVTRQTGYTAVGAETADSLADAMTRVRMPAPAFCIGGGELFADALGQADVMYVTEIARDFDGDTMFPAFDPSHWREIAREVAPRRRRLRVRFRDLCASHRRCRRAPGEPPREEH